MVEENLCPGCNRNPSMKYGGRLCEWCWRCRIRERGLPWRMNAHLTGTLVILALLMILVGLNVWVYLW